MRIWSKKRLEEATGCGVASAAMAGASRQELAREGLKALKQNQDADRVGIWLDPGETNAASGGFAGAFHGLVWDRATGEDCPPEWRVLSLEPPLPEKLLIQGKPMEQDLAASSHNPVFGQLVGLRRALWIPIGGQCQVRGLILVGSTSKSPASAFGRANSVAAELALALEMERQLRDGRIRSADLALTQNILEARSDTSTDELLSRVVVDCLRHSAGGEGLGATFAVIGALASPDASASTPLDFRWRQGNEEWTRAVTSDPMTKLWRQALETHQIVGGEPPETWAQATVARIVALPLEAEGHLYGVLVAGLSAGAASISTLERLKLRANLAAFVLQGKKQREEQSRRAGAEQSLLEQVGEPLLLLDDSGQIVAASRGARELFRRAAGERAELSGQLTDLFCERDRERVHAWLRQALDSRAGGQAAAWSKTQSAELPNGTGMRLHFTPGLPGQAATVSLQFAERSESAGHAENAEVELQSLIEWLEEGVILFDARENVRAINARFEQMAGLSPGESGKSKTLEELISKLAEKAANPRHFAERWRDLARNAQGPMSEQLQMARPSPRVLERAARPVLDAIGRHIGRVEIYHDLTAQRLFDSKLLQTEKLAALGQMVSGIAHELSSPLTSILGYSQRLLAEQDAHGRASEARQIYQEAERASTILRQLLLNSRETIPERRLVSLNQIVTSALELQRFSLAAGKVRVELDLDAALPFIFGDAGQLQQVLINLLGNARQAMGEHSQEGVLRLRTRRAGDRRVLLEVQDNGPGIPEAIQARIFDPFFTTKPAGVGTGLGLAIVLGVVREHGGQVRVQSPPQGGALFQIEIPAASERQREDALNSLPREGKTPPAQQPQPMSVANLRTPPLSMAKDARVLVVEDEPTVARLIADVLEDEGMQVDVLLDGREALDRAARETYDLVICDMKMPGLDGQHFYRSLARTGNSLRERFLFVTGDVMAAQTRQFLERHRLPHVAKPFRVEELTEKVHAVLQTRRRESAAASGTRKNAARNG
ncbi:MAG TPA: ATP-binding protein [Candidatus Acidoferrum sp.]|nr:ATP-binding protein [Candidatus Acidoferrum sp.]